MRYLILTHGRANKQITYNSLPPHVRNMVEFVVQKREEHLHGPERKLIVLPDEIRTIAKTRQWIVENIPDRYVVMMDDDLRFNVRRTETGFGKLHVPTEQELEDMFVTLQDKLKLYPQVGVSQREGNNREENHVKEVARCTGMFGLDLEYVRSKGLTFDRTKTKEDLDMTLQILNTGTANIVLYNWTREAGKSNAEGGCSSYRTHEMLDEDAHYFASLWPGIVKVVKKTTKGSWGGGERVDVTVQWKKCYEQATEKL